MLPEMEIIDPIFPEAMERLCPHAPDVVVSSHALGKHHPVIEQITGHGPGFAWCYDEKRYVRSHV